MFKNAVLGNRPDSSFTSLHALMCGALCGAVSVPLTHPFDVVKTNMMGLRKFRNVFDCVRTLLAEEGTRSLFKGMGMRMMRVMSEQAVCFALFEYISTILDEIL